MCIPNRKAKSVITLKTLLRFVDQLERKYGWLPSIIATRGDYIGSWSSLKRLRLLEKAFKLAERFKDKPSKTLIASSLAETYIEDLRNFRLGRK